VTRKPIQIAIAPNGCLYAVCDDGTIWFRHPPIKDWIQIENIPQPDGGAQ
jgi:hypothetical protein